MPSPIEFVKDHPIAVGVAAVVVIGGAVLVFGDGGGSDDGEPLVGYPPTMNMGGGSSVEAGAELARIAATEKVELARTAAQREVALAEQATQFSIAEMAKAFAETELLTNANLAMEEFDYREHISTLEADLERREIESREAMAEAQQATLRHQQSTMVDLVREQRKPRGLFSWLFG